MCKLNIQHTIKNKRQSVHHHIYTTTPQKRANILYVRHIAQPCVVWAAAAAAVVDHGTAVAVITQPRDDQRMDRLDGDTAQAAVARLAGGQRHGSGRRRVQPQLSAKQ